MAVSNEKFRGFIACFNAFLQMVYSESLYSPAVVTFRLKNLFHLFYPAVIEENTDADIGPSSNRNARDPWLHPRS
jgi:hypothetical protein